MPLFHISQKDSLLISQNSIYNMVSRKYKYVFFDAGELTNGHPDISNYYYICTSDLRLENDVEVISYPSEGKSRWFHALFILAQKISQRYSSLSFVSRLFYPFYFNKRYRKDEKICFVIYGYYITPSYLRYIRHRFPKSVIVKIHRDSYDIWKRKNPMFSEQDIYDLFDFQFSYDIGDSRKYNMIHFDEIESKTEITLSRDYPLFDVFFAGAAKDRLPFLIKIYDYLEKNGIAPFFYITNVNKEDQIVRTGITYSEQNMKYSEMLYKTVNARVVLEVNQGCVDGFTSRFLEAVLYNKKLLTNNVAVKNNEYFNEEYINIFSNPEDINVDFILQDKEVDYHYKNEFSPVHLINLIDKTLIEKYG